MDDDFQHFATIVVLILPFPFTQVSAIEVDVIEVDSDTVDMLKEMGMDKIARLQQTSGPLPYQRGGNTRS